MHRDMIWGSDMALVIVDPQRKFSLDIPDWEERMNKAVTGMNAFSKIFRENGKPVILIQFDGESHTGYSGEDADSWLPGLITDDSDIIIHKTHMNCFKETDLEKTLRDLNVDSVLFAGMLTEYCVMTTYFAAAERGFYTFLGENSTIPYDVKGNEAAEVICSTVSLGTVERFLKGEQPEIDISGH